VSKSLEKGSSQSCILPVFFTAHILLILNKLDNLKAFSGAINQGLAQIPLY